MVTLELGSMCKPLVSSPYAQYRQASLLQVVQLTNFTLQTSQVLLSRVNAFEGHWIEQLLFHNKNPVSQLIQVVF